MSTNKPVGGAQFTPGPWVVNTFIVNGQHKLEVLDATGANACVQANAHLIAAAPAMYEALKALHSVLDQRMPDGRTLNQHLSREVFECFYGPAIAARVAIAKAEGA